MKKYLEIKSFGHIDVEAFTLIGASTKRNDSNTIGMYGSGNKYSIATMLNKGISFKVFSGEDEIKFDTKETSFRDQSFKIILVNGNETSLTTTMGGSDWDSAFAPIREIYSNALDEDKDATLKSTSEIIPEHGYTKFFIEMTPDVKHFYDNVHLYFCNHNPKVLYSDGSNSIFQNTDEGKVRIFRRGILSHTDEKSKSVFHYNLHDIDINESRVIKYVWQIESKVARVLKSVNDVSTINQLLLTLNGGNAGYLEHNCDWNTYSNFSDAWEIAIKDKKFAPVEFVNMFDEKDLKGRFQLPMKLLKALKMQFEDLDVLGLNSKTDISFIEVTPNEVLLDKVLDALDLLKNTMYKNRFSFDLNIKYVKFFDSHTLGLAENDIIYLSSKLDTYSVDEIAKIIIEENEHNISGYGDETREFQNHWINLYFEELKK
jgi:hypothetical protein